MAIRIRRILKAPLFRIALVLLVPVALLAGLVLSGRGAADRQSEDLLTREVPSGVIDERTGAYQGISRGDPMSEVRRELGDPIDEDAGISQPQVAWNTVWNGIDLSVCRKWWRGPPPRFRLVVYRDVVFTIVNGRVCSYEVAGGGWSTTGGTRAGDGIEAIRRRFGPRACAQVNYTEDPLWRQWLCSGRTASGIRMRFAGDPVSSVAVN